MVVVWESDEDEEEAWNYFETRRKGRSEMTLTVRDEVTMDSGRHRP